MNEALTKQLTFADLQSLPSKKLRHNTQKSIEINYNQGMSSGTSPNRFAGNATFIFLKHNPTVQLYHLATFDNLQNQSSSILGYVACSMLMFPSLLQAPRDLCRQVGPRQLGHDLQRLPVSLHSPLGRSSLPTPPSPVNRKSPVNTCLEVTTSIESSV